MDESKQPGIRFLGVELLRLNFDITQVAMEDLSYGVSFKTDARISADEKHLDLFMGVDLFGDMPKAKRPKATLEFILLGSFEIVGKQNMPIEQYAREHAPALLVPYVRETIANITTRSALPTLNIGPINVIALAKAGKSDIDIHAAKKDEGWPGEPKPVAKKN